MKAWGIKRLKDKLYFSRSTFWGHEWSSNINDACYEWSTKDSARRFCDKGEIPVALEVVTKISLWKGKK